ncbi:histidine phosphatase family protein [Postechiella marina]|uniref:Histidine phosphatase family protein n=1 Tax=Postechiella marina TaxID=943941 RepID=A0ABP8C058_9FLAO
MKKLIIIRHAKSSWKYDVIDHERPLNSRGLSDSVLISSTLKFKNITADLVMVSDAFRTKETANIILKALKFDENKVIFNHDLYDFEGRNLLQVIKNCDKSINTLMVFGHNHAITSFVNTYGNKIIENVPTCGVVIIDFDIDSWKGLKKGKTVETIFPKNLKN